MRIRTFVYSPCGSTEKIAETFAEEMGRLCGEELTEENMYVDLAVYGKTGEGEKAEKDDLVILAAPSFGGRVPPDCAAKMREIRADGCRAVVIAVYGNRAYEDTLAELYDIAEECGMNVIAAGAFIAEHSIVREFAAGRPDSSDLEEIRDFAGKVDEKIQKERNGEAGGRLQIPGSRPYKEYRVMPIVLLTCDRCIRCGICAAACPVGAIDHERPEITDAGKCIGCMRCVSVCPHNAKAADPERCDAIKERIGEFCRERKKNEIFL